MRLRRKDWGFAAAAAAAVVLPLLISLPLSDSFYRDWYNHSWMIQYFAENFRRHLAFPTYLNTTLDFAMPTPLFYGYLFYPLAALPALVLGPGLTMRALALGAFALQWLLAFRVTRKAGASARLAFTVATLVTWAVYPLVNLYNRSAMTEFYAVALLFCAVLTWFELLLESDSSRRRRDALLCGLLFCLAVGTHPITGLCGGVVFAILFALAARERGAKQLLTLAAPPAALGLLALAPWLYMVARFHGQITISLAARGWSLFRGIDDVVTRFVPLDFRMGPGINPKDISTPYLTPTVNGPLLVLTLAALLKAPRRLAVEIGPLTLAVFAVLYTFSLSSAAQSLLPGAFAFLQFSYRLVSYADLAVLCGLVILLVRCRGRCEPHGAVLLVCLALAGAGVATKWWQSAASRNSEPAEGEGAPLTRFPTTFGGYPDYEMPKLLASLPEGQSPSAGLRFTPLENERFGEWYPVPLTLKQESWVLTNVQVFRWNHLLVDGQELADADQARFLVTTPDSKTEGSLLHNRHLFTIARVPAGSHVFDLRIQPEPAWRILRVVSWLALLAWCILLALPTRVFDKISSPR